MKKKIFCILLIMFMVFSITACKNKEYTVTFISNGETINATTITKETSLEIPLPEKTGYDFVGWFIDEDCTKAFSASEKIDENISVYAKFEIKKFDIVFKIENEDFLTGKADYNTSLSSLPNSPSKEGFHFVGWYYENTYKNEFSVDTKITQNITLYGRYSANTIILTFRSAGNEDITKQFIYGETFSDIPSVPLKENFIGNWELENFDNIKCDTVINAVYHKEYIKITFVSSLNNERNESEFNLLYNESFDYSQLPEPYPYYGYTAVWEENNLINVKNDITINAIYTPNMYEVKFNNQEGTTIKTLSIEYNTKISSEDIPSVPNNENNIYIWASNNLKVVSLPITGDTVFQPSEFYIITFELNGGEFAEDSIYQENQIVAISSTGLEDFALKDRYGYRFLGWYIDNNFQNEYDISDPIDSNRIIYAKWEEILCNVYFPVINGITFDAVSENPIKYGQDFVFTITTEKECTVMGNGNNILQGTQIQEGINEYTITDITDNHNIAVAFDDVAIKTISFFDENLQPLYIKNVSAGQKLLNVPDVPNSSNADIAYWALNNDPINFSEITIENNMDIFPRYKFDTYWLYYYLNNAENGFFPKVVNYLDQTFYFYNPPKYEGYLFDGWYLDENFDEIATKEYIINSGYTITLYAKWIPEFEIESEIIGQWVADNIILNFYNNGLVEINDKDNYIEYNFRIENNKILILNSEVFFDNENDTIIYKNNQFAREINKAIIVKFADIKLETVFSVINADDIMGYTWYTDEYHNNIFDISQPIDIENPNIINNFLKLYRSSFRSIVINYYPTIGTMQNPIQNLIINENGISSNLYDKNQITIPEGKIFRGWTQENSYIIVDKEYINNLSDYTINLYASYYDEEYNIYSDTQEKYGLVEGNQLTLIKFNENFTFTIYQIDFNTKTVIRSIDFVYDINEEDENIFIDEFGNNITIGENSITIKLFGEGEFDNIPLYEFALPENKAYQKEISYYDEESQTNRTEINTYIISGKKFIINGTINDLFCYDELYYYLDNLNKLNNIDFSMYEFLYVSDEFSGNYTGTMEMVVDNVSKNYSILLEINNDFSYALIISGNGENTSFNGYLLESENGYLLASIGGEITYNGNTYTLSLFENNITLQKEI